MMCWPCLVPIEAACNFGRSLSLGPLASLLRVYQETFSQKFDGKCRTFVPRVAAGVGGLRRVESEYTGRANKRTQTRPPRDTTNGISRSTNVSHVQIARQLLPILENPRGILSVRTVYSSSQSRETAILFIIVKVCSP